MPKNRQSAWQKSKFDSPLPPDFGKLKIVAGKAHDHEKFEMKLASANKIGGLNRPQSTEQAQVRIVVLVLGSFLLGVAATVSWFHFASNRNVENSSSPTSSQSSTGAPAETAVNANRPSRPYNPYHPPVDSTTIEEVKQAIPNFASLSLADGEQILREAALKQFTAAAKEMDVQVKQARQQLVQAENNQSAAAQQSALEHLRQTQEEETEKIQQIAAHLQSQIAALKQLKNAK